MKPLLSLLLLTIALFAGIQQDSFSSDTLGSTRAIVDNSGHLTDTYDHSPYGELRKHSGTSDNAFLFTGEQYDPEAVLYYLRARYYSPELARFLSRDTFEETLSDPLSQNTYLYARGNPVLYVDPSGHFFCGLASGMISMMATTITSFNMVTAGSANLYVPVAISAYHVRIGMELRAEALNSIIFALTHSKIYFIPNGKKSDSEQLIDLAYKKYEYATMLIRMGGLFADSTREAFKYIGYYTGFAKEIASYTKAQDYVTAYQAATAIVKAKQYELIKIANNLDLLRRSTPSIIESIQNLNKLLIALCFKYIH